MESNNILVAPQIADVNAFYSEWQRNHAGSVVDFYKFMTTPSTERDNFLAEMDAVTEFAGTVVNTTLKK